MALANFAAYRTAIATPVFRSELRKDGSATGAIDGAWASSLLLAGFPAAVSIPTTSVAVDKTSTGAMWTPGATGRKILVGSDSSPQFNSRIATTANGVLIDRLNHSGGMVSNINTLQTTNLPTAALTRHTDGVGVYAALQFWVAGGATDTVATVKYTNTADTADRTSVLTITGTPALGSFWVLPLQSGDIGVKSVQSLQFSISTGIAGNVGVVLFKPVAFLPGAQRQFVAAGSITGWNTAIHNDAFLELLYMEWEKPVADERSWYLSIGDV